MSQKQKLKIGLAKYKQNIVEHFGDNADSFHIIRENKQLQLKSS